jgi:hypothetical protein
MNAPIRIPRIVVFITASSFSFLELLNDASCLEYLGLKQYVHHNICTKNGAEFSFGSLLGHGHPFFKVANKGTQDMDYSTQRRIR